MIKIYKNIECFDKNFKNQVPSIAPYLINDKEIHPCIIVIPGGGYEFLANHEGAPIASYLNSIGINAFVLTYRVSPYKHPCPLLDVQRAIRFIRYNHKKFNIYKDKIGVIGFSAGGHLSAASSVFFDNGKKIL